MVPWETGDPLITSTTANANIVDVSITNLKSKNLEGFCRFQTSHSSKLGRPRAANSPPPIRPRTYNTGPVVEIVVHSIFKFKKSYSYI